jgi:hypothetical protein
MYGITGDCLMFLRHGYHGNLLLTDTIAITITITDNYLMVGAQ